MNRRPACLAALLTMALLSCGPGQSPEAVGSDEVSVRDSVVALMARLSEAATRKDVDAFMALWEPSDSVVYTRSGLTFIGWDEIAANHEAAFSTPGTWRFEPVEVYPVVLGPEAATATGFNLSASYGPDGEESTGWFTITIVARATELGWRVVQAHGSYPEPGHTPRGTPE